ncbi:hypothetical protein F5Y13DRAFT_206991 [Hypoxylon sp. FL1857]|nr:hypothetical protein F5Y13DRAFT_206991 [Hypoxylon sp. FL1857]
MESMKRFLNPGKKDGRRNTEDIKRQISWPLENSPHRQEQVNVRASVYKQNNVRVDFAPRTQGKRATLAFANSGRPNDLAKLLDEQNRAERHVSQGPKTIGNKEVHLILREPSIRSVERFYHVRKQAELSMKYGIPGEVAYNFSRSVTWNQTNAPSLQLAGFEHRGVFSNTPGPMPISSPLSTCSTMVYTSNSRQLSPISEPGGWRDLPYPNSEESEFNLRGSVRVPLDEYEVGEAKVLKIRKVPFVSNVEISSCPPWVVLGVRTS